MDKKTRQENEFANHLLVKVGGLDAAMLQGFYEATAHNPSGREYAPIPRMFVYQGPFFETPYATLALSPESSRRRTDEEILETPQLEFRARRFEGLQDYVLTKSGLMRVKPLFSGYEGQSPDDLAEEYGFARRVAEVYRSILQEIGQTAQNQ